MIQYEHFTLDNGLKVFVHEDHTVPIAALNIIYNVGSRDEDEQKTGFAHLFEHLMFGGSANIPNFDTPLQQVGGDNNAFTSPDVTNYYITLPAENLETAFWLESDRMMGLSFDPEVLEVQRKVVIEEYKQRYLNQPYGDVWLKLRDLAYQKHPYRWPTIGREISHIEEATMDDVKGFFYKYYCPNNAIMVVAGNVGMGEVKKLSEKWFGPISPQKVPVRNLPKEPVQHAPKLLEVEANVPVDAIYKVYHMSDRLSPTYTRTDLLSDVLGRGKASRLYRRLVKDRKLFSSISASVTGSSDPGLLVISGRLTEDTSLEEADQAIQAEIALLQENIIGEEELQKAKNQAEATILFSEIEVLSRAINLAFSANLGKPELVNQTLDMIEAVTVDDIHLAAQEVLVPNNSSTLYYRKKAGRN